MFTNSYLPQPRPKNRNPYSAPPPGTMRGGVPYQPPWAAPPVPQVSAGYPYQPQPQGQAQMPGTNNPGLAAPQSSFLNSQWQSGSANSRTSYQNSSQPQSVNEPLGQGIGQQQYLPYPAMQQNGQQRRPSPYSGNYSQYY